MKFVVDASACAKFWVRETGSRKARELLASGEADNDLIVPWHMPAETISVFIKTRLKKNGVVQGLRAETIKRYTDDLMELVRDDILRVVDVNMPKAVELASLDTGGQGHLSIYDTIYHALAIQEDAKFVTDDAAYVRKLQNHARLRTSVVLLENLEL